METNLQSGNSYSDRIKFFINQKNLNNRELTKILGYKSSFNKKSPKWGFFFIPSTINQQPSTNINKFLIPYPPKIHLALFLFFAKILQYDYNCIHTIGYYCTNNKCVQFLL